MASIDASITSTGLISTGDATGILQLKSNGITALTVHANANVSIASGLSVSGSNVQPLILATQQTASGSTVDFTGIPSWVKKVTVMLNGVSASSIGDFYLRLGTGGVLATTGYFGVVSSISSGATATGTVTASSDERIKTNIKTIENGLEKVSQLRGVEYDRIDIKSHQIGVIAQEVERVLPNIVHTDEKGMKSVAYGNLTAVLIEAIKELKGEISELKEKVAKLEGTK